VGFALSKEEVDAMYSRIDVKETGLMKWGTFITCLSTNTKLRYEMLDTTNMPVFMDKPEIVSTQ
jgi:Ca2+-binding EF-hand superfamily protein